MSPKLLLLINRDAYLKEWRLRSAVLFMAFNTSESSIVNLLEGNKSIKEIKNICESEGIPFNYARKILGI